MAPSSTTSSTTSPPPTVLYPTFSAVAPSSLPPCPPISLPLSVSPSIRVLAHPSHISRRKCIIGELKGLGESHYKSLEAAQQLSTARAKPSSEKKRKDDSSV